MRISPLESQKVSGVRPKADDAKAHALLKRVRLDIFRDGRGVHEGPNNDNKYTGQLLGNRHLPWCAAYVSVMLKEAGISAPSSASCASLASQFRSAGRYTNASQTPQPGDVIFFGRPEHHTGFVEKVENGKVYTVEGNSSDAVSERVYDLSDPRISGYGKVFNQVSSDLGFDTNRASTRSGGSSPAARSTGQGSASRATDTGLDAGVHTQFGPRTLLDFLLALLRQDFEAIAALLQEIFPGVSEEDLANVQKALSENPALLPLMLSDPQGTLEKLVADPSAEGIAAMLAAPLPKKLSDEAQNRIQFLERLPGLEPEALQRLELGLARLPKAKGWQPPSQQPPRDTR